MKYIARNYSSRRSIPYPMILGPGFHDLHDDRVYDSLEEALDAYDPHCRLVWHDHGGDRRSAALSSGHAVEIEPYRRVKEIRVGMSRM